MQPGSAPQSAPLVCSVHCRNRTDGNMAAPGTIAKIAAAMNSRMDSWQTDWHLVRPPCLHF